MADDVVFNVRLPPYNAIGDGAVDDTDAIQTAINDAAAFAAEAPESGSVVVFLPKGFYRISRTLNITSARPRGHAGATLALLGAARHLSVLMPQTDGLTGMAGPAAQPVLHVGRGDARVALTLFSIVTWEHLSSVWALHWENENMDSVYRQNYFYRICECLYGFPHPLPRPQQHPTIPCKASALLLHPLNVIAGAHRLVVILLRSRRVCCGIC